MYTDKFFRFPIKIYDGFSARQAERKEELADMPIEAQWYAGMAALPLSEFTSNSVYWYESFSIGEDPHEQGFNSTMIYSERFGGFTCVWKMEKFEKELNKFIEKWEVSL